MYNIFFRNLNASLSGASGQVPSSTFQNIQPKRFSTEMKKIFSFDSYAKSNFTLNLFLLLLGFLFGNLFPTFFGEFIGKAYIFILILLESFNYFYYVMSFSWVRGATRFGARRPIEPRTIKYQNSIDFGTETPKHPFNCLKIGFLFGLFVDAFKVGS